MAIIILAEEDTQALSVCSQAGFQAEEESEQAAESAARSHLLSAEQHQEE